MKLYLVTGKTDEDDDVDLFVWAEDQAQALQLWKAYYKGWGRRKATHVFEVPLTPSAAPMALAWGEQVLDVLGVPPPAKTAPPHPKHGDTATFSDRPGEYVLIDPQVQKDEG
jgi:hypothetical protein